LLFFCDFTNYIEKMLLQCDMPFSEITMSA